MARKKDDPTGFAFVGFFFLGFALAAFYGRWDVSPFLALGLGFTAMMVVGLMKKK